MGCTKSFLLWVFLWVMLNFWNYKRIKIFIGTKEEETTLWDHDAVDEFYKDDISWLDDDALTASDKQLQYYEVLLLLSLSWSV